MKKLQEKIPKNISTSSMSDENTNTLNTYKNNSKKSSKINELFDTNSKLKEKLVEKNFDSKNNEIDTLKEYNPKTSLKTSIKEKNEISSDENYTSKLSSNPNENNTQNNQENNSNKTQKNSSPRERSKLKMLLRFNCGKCQKKLSKIFLPESFCEPCSKCKFPADIVVLRCTNDTLYGGFLCCACESRFLVKIDMEKFKQDTPFCFDCNRHSKLYQALLNKSKISVKNIKIFICLKCKGQKTKSFYQPYGILDYENYKPHCCEERMVFYKIEREFTHYKLDDFGRSEKASVGGITGNFNIC